MNGIHCDTLQRLESNKHSTLPQTTRCLNQRHQDFMRSVANSLTARHNALSDPATQGQDTENPRFSFTTSQRRRIQRHLPLPRRCADRDNYVYSTTKTRTQHALRMNTAPTVPSESTHRPTPASKTVSSQRCRCAHEHAILLHNTPSHEAHPS